MQDSRIRKTQQSRSKLLVNIIPLLEIKQDYVDSAQASTQRQKSCGRAVCLISHPA